MKYTGHRLGHLPEAYKGQRIFPWPLFSSEKVAIYSAVFTIFDKRWTVFELSACRQNDWVEAGGEYLSDRLTYNTNPNEQTTTTLARGIVLCRVLSWMGAIESSGSRRSFPR